ncbi:hypothetical protein MMC31_001203 [Peltigera leucophlebia]|nr:hypothetical protein [Peltigera leucophlebia]
MRTAGFIALAAAVQQAAAHGWTSAPAFSCPSNTNNLCDPDQEQGFDWSKDLKQYSDFSFSKFVIVSKFNNKRELAPRTNKFQVSKKIMSS